MPPKPNSPRRRKTVAPSQPPTKKARVSNITAIPVLPRKPRPRKTEEGVVMTCGMGEVGQLGLGPSVMEKKRFSVVPGLQNVVDICAGGMHTVCLTADGSVYTFGCDDDGALGRNATDTNSFVPTRVDLTGTVVQISAGDSHSAALLDDGRVFAWGSFRDSHGPMGLTQPQEKSTRVIPARTPTLIALKDSVEKIASGTDHLVLLTVQGQLFTAGCPEQGQLGRIAARSANRDARGGIATCINISPVIFRRKVCFIDVWATSYGTYAKEKSKTIYCWGLNNYRQLGLEKEAPIFRPLPSPLGGPDAEWVKVEGGDHHTILLNSAGKVFSLGRKEYGRLGLGRNTDDAGEVTLVPLPAAEKFVDIGCGTSVSFAVSEIGEVWGWGLGSNGQLSTGDDDDDVWEPMKLRAKQLENKAVILVAGGGQHTVLLAKEKA